MHHEISFATLSLSVISYGFRCIWSKLNQKISFKLTLLRVVASMDFVQSDGVYNSVCQAWSQDQRLLYVNRIIEAILLEIGAKAQDQVSKLKLKIL